MLASFPKLPNT